LDNNLKAELQALTQLVSYQMAINILPFDAKYSEFISYGLKQVVKTSRCRVCLYFTNEPEGESISEGCKECNFYNTGGNPSKKECLLFNREDIVVVPIITVRKTFGFIAITDPLNIRPSILASIRNFANIIAVNIENKLQKDALESQNKELFENKNHLEELIQFNSQIINSLQEGIIVYDRDLKYTVWNPFMEKITGMPAEKVLGKHPAEVFPILQEAGIIDTLQKTLKGENVNAVDFPFYIPESGYSGWSSDKNIPFYDSKGEIIGVIGSVHEITVRKQIEEAHRRQNSMLNTLLENLQIGVYMLEAQSGIPLLANEASFRLLGRGILPEANSATITRVYDLYKSNSDIPYPNEELPLVVAMSGVSKHVDDMDVMKPDGTRTALEVFGSPVLDENGKVWASLVSFQDITERKKAEKELKEKMDELVDAYQQLEKYAFDNKELKQFAYISSHQLQQPLRTIKNFVNILEEDHAGLFDANAIRNLDAIKESAERMNALILGLSDYSRLGLNKKLSTVNCNELVSDVIADLNAMIESSGAKIKVLELPALNAFEVEFRQVFQNLIVNSIKFQKKDTLPEIQISAEKINDKWKFSICDNGIGIPKDQFNKLFNMYYRLHVSEKLYVGKGIGLAFCKKIVELHQGEIWVEANKGSGVTFHFTIPNLKV
jgi:PAS domain S-box-containing protein